jgi:hypothetical protein
MRPSRPPALFAPAAAISFSLRRLLDAPWFAVPHSVAVELFDLQWLARSARKGGVVHWLRSFGRGTVQTSVVL